MKRARSRQFKWISRTFDSCERELKDVFPPRCCVAQHRVGAENVWLITYSAVKQQEIALQVFARHRDNNALRQLPSLVETQTL